jgi:hypothetical protein
MSWTQRCPHRCAAAMVTTANDSRRGASRQPLSVPAMSSCGRRAGDTGAPWIGVQVHNLVEVYDAKQTRSSSVCRTVSSASDFGGVIGAGGATLSTSGT